MSGTPQHGTPQHGTPQLVHELLDQAAGRHPDRTALSSRERSLTYRALARESVRAAGLLRSRGVRRGDRVVLTAADGVTLACFLYGTARLGAVFTVLHEQVHGEPLRHVLRDCEPAVVVSDDPEVERTSRQSAVPFLPAGALHAAGEEPEEDGGAPADRAAGGLPAPGTLPVDPACLIYTSGTTALPKAVVSTHQQVLFAATAIQSCLGYRAGDIVYCPLPLSFDYGLYQLYLAALSGAALRLGTVAESGPPLLRSLEESGATVLTGVPAVTDRLAWLVRRSRTELTRLRLLTNTGAALSEATMASLRKALPGLRIQVMYGLTECKRTAIMPPDGDLERAGSCGLPLPGTEVFVLGDGGEKLPPGEIGQFVVRGPHVMAGYWRRPELTAEKFPRRDGLFPELLTGDYGWQDEDGYLYFSGRRDDLYKQQGFRISATEVEAAAHRVDGVTSAAVLPPTDRRKSVLAVVSEIAGQDVLERMREHIEPFKIPGRCVRLDSLPVNGNGKVDRRRLAALLEAEPRAAETA